MHDPAFGEQTFGQGEAKALRGAGDESDGHFRLGVGVGAGVGKHLGLRVVGLDHWFLGVFAQILTSKLYDYPYPSPYPYPLNFF
jgi:hypothetical protein